MNSCWCFFICQPIVRSTQNAFDWVLHKSIQIHLKLPSTNERYIFVPRMLWHRSITLLSSEHFASPFENIHRLQFCKRWLLIARSRIRWIRSTRWCGCVRVRVYQILSLLFFSRESHFCVRNFIYIFLMHVLLFSLLSTSIAFHYASCASLHCDAIDSHSRNKAHNDINIYMLDKYILKGS